MGDFAVVEFDDPDGIVAVIVFAEFGGDGCYACRIVSNCCCKMSDRSKARGSDVWFESSTVWFRALTNCAD